MQAEYLINCNKLMLHVQDGISLSCQPVKSHLVREKNKLIEYRLVFLVNWENYLNITSSDLLYFDSDFHQGNIQAGDFFPEYDIQITTLLRPDLLPNLETYGDDEAAIIAYLQKLSQKEPNNVLLSAESWFMLSAEQKQPKGLTSYRTLWDYLDWRAITQSVIPRVTEELIMEGTISFFHDSATRYLLGDNVGNQKMNSQATEVTKHLLETLFAVAPSIYSQPEDAKKQLVPAITNVFKYLLDASISTEFSRFTKEEKTDENSGCVSKEIGTRRLATKENTILVKVVEFFQTEKWLFTQLPNQSVIRTHFQGENGKWECYAQVREIQHQFLFYSVLSLKVTEIKRLNIAEFITRANYGTILGNFEFDFDDGEIRYKTSIAVDRSHLNSEMIRQLVYSNVLNTDKYLPGILQIINGELSPADAIAQIEQ